MRYSAGKRNLLYLQKENHGYNAMHIPSQWAAFRAQWARRLADPGPATWKAYVLAGLDNNPAGWSLGPYTVFSYISTNNLPISKCWKAIIETTRKLGYRPSKTDSLAQPLFFNPNMRSLFSAQKWAIFTRAGIRVLSDQDIASARKKDIGDFDIFFATKTVDDTSACFRKCR